MTANPSPSPPPLTGEDLTVHHPEWGAIHVRNKRPANIDTFPPDRIVILQHGATYGSSAFDLAFDGLSWMDYLARHGFDAYCLDLPGYGRSARPAQMDAPPETNPPFMRTADAADCLAAVVDHVCERRGVESLSLIGWSWGTAITSLYTSKHADRVERLVLYAPVWDRTNARSAVDSGEAELGAYRTVNRAATAKRRQAGLSPEQATQIMPPEWFDQWWQATRAADQGNQPDAISAPNGVVLDGREYWSRGRPLYDPAAITTPVLVVVGELDRDTPPALAQTLFPLLTSAPWKRLTVLSGGTHSIMMERARPLLFRTVQQFLEEEPPETSQS